MIMFEFECELFFSSLHYVTVGRNLEFICTCFFSSFFIAWDQASQWGKKENTGYLSAPFARRFFLLPSAMRSLIPGYFLCSDDKNGHKNLRYLILNVNATWCSSRVGTPFSDHTSKIHTRFQTWPLGRNYVIIHYRFIRLERKQKILETHFEFAYFSFFLSHLELKR